MLWLVAQSCPTLYDTLDCSPPGSSVHGDSPGKNTGVSCHFLLQGIFPTQGSNKPSSTHPAGRFFTDGATREAQEYRSRLGTYTEISVLTLAPWKKSYDQPQFSSVQLLSRVRFCDPMNCSTPGLPVHHQLPEFTQTHVHRVSDAIQPSQPLLSPSPPTPNPSQHQSLFQCVNSSHEVAKVLEFQPQHQSFQ